MSGVRLTYDCELGSRLAVFSLAGVFAGIALLHVVDDQFSDAPVLFHLVFLSRFQNDSAFPPADCSSRFGELTAENAAVPFLYHQAPDLPFKCYRKCCWKMDLFW